MKRLFSILVLLASVLMSLTANAANTELLGAGATFPYPLYSKMFHIYYKESGIKVNYQAIGSGGGIRQIRNKTVDFGASDAFLSDKEMKAFKNPVVHIPIVAGAVVITYNLTGNFSLKLTPEIISNVFLGKITKWNDPQIKDANPSVKLPDMHITVVHRSDGSGTTFIFSDYLGKISKAWKMKVGTGKSLDWPIGLGAKGNPGVAGLIKQIPGSIGYVELIYALKNNMPIASIRNKSGNFIVPGIKSVSEAANVKLPDDLRISLTNTIAKYGYPISGFTYILVYKNLKNGGLSYKKAKEVVKLLWWMTHKGQKYAVPLHYAPLSEKALKKSEKIINALRFDGKNLQ